MYDVDIEHLMSQDEDYSFESVSFLNHTWDQKCSGNETIWKNESFWDWDEREINGDVAVIPMSDHYDTQILSSSPPSKDWQKIIYDWQHLILDGDITPMLPSLHNNPVIPVEHIEQKFKFRDMEWNSHSELKMEDIFETKDEIVPVLQAADLNTLLEKFEAVESIKEEPLSEEIVEKTPAPSTNKQIRDALPQELIKRINATSKRKPVPLIPPIPTKQRCVVKTPEPKAVTTAQLQISLENIHLDHDYCSSLSSYSRDSRKDSGFESSEDEEKHILKNQPVVKNADGKLMISLLKTNTIQTDSSSEQVPKKRKLNLEEYKRRQLEMKIHVKVPEKKTILDHPEVKDDKIARHLEDLGPILQNAGAKINKNSLITSLIENMSAVKHPEKTIRMGRHKLKKINSATRLLKTKHQARSRSSSCSSSSRSKSPEQFEEERLREVEERRIVYVGGLSNAFTREDLYRRFRTFGPITKVSVHFREHGDNYGFVTFTQKDDAYNAVERGNDDLSKPHYDLSFGGRRLFCRAHYCDLDNINDEGEHSRKGTNVSFDILLKEAQAKLYQRH